MVAEKVGALFKIKGRVDESISNRFKNEDFFISMYPPEILYLTMETTGGDLGEASRFVDLVQILVSKNTKIVTINNKFISSAGLPIFACGSTRVSNNSLNTFFFHRATRGKLYVTEQQILEGERSSFELMADQFNLSIDSIYDLANASKKINSLEAKKLGIIHMII